MKVLTGDDITEAKITAAALTSEVHQLAHTGPPRSSGRMGRALRGDYAPGGILAVLVLALGAATGARAPHFLGALNLSATFLLAAVPCPCVKRAAAGLLGASIDLSVGPLMGLTVVILSFFDQQGSGYGGLVIGGADRRPG